ncbi:sialidase family protein [Caulobacter sp. S45]|uniref:WD40/YVTN/BNR-like repeat-containing protein n=1 Tax=Caulobacter sp. S45 TaxID=1641861 RepID=UPI00131CE96C|nr:sialidase family protein [Caulobacter sp. S45]
MRTLTFLLITASLACTTRLAAQPAPSITGAGGPAMATVAREMTWRMIGPFRGGRTRAVTGVATQPNVFYIGAVNGGVWKTEDAGNTWHSVFDDQPTQSIGSIAVAPSDPNIVYVGSGEGQHRPDLSIGDGIYKTTDAGKTWTHLGLRDGQQIPDLAVDPNNPNRVFAAVLGHPYGPNAERGVYRSLDGGKTWERVLFKDEDTGAYSIAIDPSQPQTVYASLWEDRHGPWEDRNAYQGLNGGLFKSTDGGATWRKLTNGLPENTAQLIVTVSSANPKRLFATVSTRSDTGGKGASGSGLYRSDDAGESWSRITDDPRPLPSIADNDLPTMRPHPTNPDIVYMSGIMAMKSVDGGKTWGPVRGAPGGDDYQNVWINPVNPDIIIYGVDQGATITLNGGKTWSTWFNQSTGQLYHVTTTTNTFPYRVCGGYQDSGSVCISSRGNDGAVTVRDWHPVGASEYAQVAPDPLDPDVIYGAGRSQVSRFHWSTGLVENVTPVPILTGADRVDRTQPIMFASSDPHALYYATSRVYRTRDGGTNWEVVSPDLTREKPGLPASVGAMHGPGMENQRGVIYSLGVSPRDSNILWAGTDDGLVWTSRDGGKAWANVTPPTMTAWSKVTQIDASHFDGNTAYISVSRMRVDDQRPYVFRTRDGGKTWASIVTGLPDNAAVNAVREDTKQPGLLFAATEKAVWVSRNDGASWDSLQLNLPHTSMRDLTIQDDDLVVGTHGRSIWILDDISPLRQMKAATTNKATLLKPSAAYRVARSTWTDSPMPPDEPNGQNPPAGAMIDYYLPQDAKGLVTLEILDGQGKLVRRYRGDDPAEITEAEIKQGLVPPYWIAPHRSLSGKSGMHRWLWDMHYTAPMGARRGFPISAVPNATPRLPQGPMAIPGDYTVRLIVDGKTLEQPLTLRADPRVRATAEALRQQLDLGLTISDLLARSSSMLTQAQSQRGQLKGASANDPAISRLDTALKGVLEGEASSNRDGVARTQRNLDQLYTQVTGGAAAPTTAQLTAVHAAGEQIVRLEGEWKQAQTNVPEVDQSLRKAGLAMLHPGAAPATTPGDQDDDDDPDDL